MRRYMWKKGISMTLAAVMMAGSVTVPAVYRDNAAAIVQAAETGEMPENPAVVDGMVYATVNMEYADFYYGELNHIAANTEAATPDLSSDKAASYRETGMYDAVTSATSMKSTKWSTSYYEVGVENDETLKQDEDGNITNTNLYGIKDVQIAIPVDLYNALREQSDQSHKVYEYLKSAVYSDTAFTTEYKVLNADGTFSEMISKERTVKDEDAEATLATSTAWGNYQISIENLGVDDVSPTTDNLYGIVLTDQDGNNYGLLHSDNTWLRTGEFSWAVDSAFQEAHGNHVPYARTNGLKGGNTITKITYLLKDAADIEIDTNLKVKYLLDESVTGSAKPAAYDPNGTQVAFTLNNLPSDDYTLDSVVKGTRHGVTVEPEHYSYDATTKVLTLDETVSAGNDYVATFKSAEYGDIKVTFEITKADQTVTTSKDAYTVTYGGKAFNLGAKAQTSLSYQSSNESVAVVGEDGTVTVKGAGKATITITAIEDDYYNTTTKNVTITVNRREATITGVNSTYNKVYGNKAFNLGAKTNANKLTYTSSNKNVVTVSSKGLVTIKGTGVAKITVTASGANYITKTKTVTMKVAPKKQSVTVKSNKKKQMTVQVKKDTKATGYHIKVSTSSKFTTKTTKTYTIKSYKTYKKTLSSLTSGKKYYVKARSYKKSGNTTLYGAYSSYKSVKVK